MLWTLQCIAGTSDKYEINGADIYPCFLIKLHLLGPRVISSDVCVNLCPFQLSCLNKRNWSTFSTLKTNDCTLSLMISHNLSAPPI